MITFLIFQTEQAAIDAQSLISQNMGCPLTGKNLGTTKDDANAKRTDRWAEPRQRKDERWCFPIPEGEFLAGVIGFVKEEFDPAWFPDPPVSDSIPK